MKLSLKYLILAVALLSVFLSLVSSITAGYRVDQEALINNTLETNRVYAQKLATTTDNYLKMTLQLLAYSSKEVSGILDKEDSESLLLKEADRILQQTNSFNSVVIVSENSEILAASPQSLDLIGKFLSSTGGQYALTEKKPLISKPYISLTNRLIVFISQPVFNEQGDYKGLVGGSIYLKEENVLNELLGEHFYKDGSYVYVADEDGRLLYHNDASRINEIVTKNPVINDLKLGNSGEQQIINSNDINMLAGYAYMPTARWGVVSQRPTDVTLLSSKDMRKEMIIKSIPFLLLSFIIIILIANRISYPLQKLAHYAEAHIDTSEQNEVRDVRAWYYEAIQLESALVNSYAFFQDKVNYFIHQSTTDPLTGLFNRRAMDEQTKNWIHFNKPFSIILFDIDRFKRVNDTYGHAVGDDVLKFLATKMAETARDTDVLCRFGGEEFVILLPDTNQREAYEVAETLRKTLEKTISPCGEIITISSGVASFPDCTTHLVKLIEMADECLYEAKNTGRNKTIVMKCDQ